MIQIVAPLVNHYAIKSANPVDVYIEIHQMSASYQVAIKIKIVFMTGKVVY